MITEKGLQRRREKRIFNRIWQIWGKL